MKKQFLIFSSLCLLLTACENRNNRVDNTARNARDRHSQAITPESQGENEIDRTITQKIRQQIMADDSLSFTAKNVKVITLNGNVVLRGIVNNEREKNEIEKKVRAINGVKTIQNDLEINRSDENRAAINPAGEREGNR